MSSTNFALTTSLTMTMIKMMMTKIDKMTLLKDTCHYTNEDVADRSDAVDGNHYMNMMMITMMMINTGMVVMPTMITDVLVVMLHRNTDYTGNTAMTKDDV